MDFLYYFNHVILGKGLLCAFLPMMVAACDYGGVFIFLSTHLGWGDQAGGGLLRNQSLI